MPHALHLSAPAALLAALCSFVSSFAALAGDNGRDDDSHGDKQNSASWLRSTVQLGDRPFYLLDGLDDSRLKQKLQRCENGPFYKTDFSIGHRGAPLQFPEHTKESYEAAARQGAGIVECDVTFTKD